MITLPEIGKKVLTGISSLIGFIALGLILFSGRKNPGESNVKQEMKTQEKEVHETKKKIEVQETAHIQVEKKSDETQSGLKASHEKRKESLSDLIRIKK